jgi:hypothetical protein
MKKIYLLLVFLTGFSSFVQQLNAQTSLMSVGAKSTAMGNITTTSTDHWALENNVGALSFQKTPVVHFNFENRFGLNSFNTFVLGGVMPIGNGVGGIHFNRFGDNIYNENLIGLGYSHKISLVSIGLKANYVQVATNDPTGLAQTSRSTFTFELGGLAQISSQFSFGLYAYNLSQARLKSGGQENTLPVILRAGVAYRPNQAVFLSAEIEKDVTQKASFKAGLDYKVVKMVALRMGFSTEPFRAGGGIGVFFKDFELDYAYQRNKNLGNIHQIGLAYRFQKKQNTTNLLEK